jgi:hypothetical protein
MGWKKTILVLIAVCVATMSVAEIQKIDKQIKKEMVKIVKDLERQGSLK